MTVVQTVVRVSAVVLVGCAAAISLVGVFNAQALLDQKAELDMMNNEAPRTAASMDRDVASAKSARPNYEPQPPAVRKAEDPLPVPGRDVSDALASIEPQPVAPAQANEPARTSKEARSIQLIAPDALLSDGMKAVTIRVSNAEGIAGFALEERWVDVAMTRQTGKNLMVNDIIVQSARILAVDQVADSDGDRLGVRAVTLETDPVSAQKLVLASQIGTLSLILRKTDDRSVQDARQVSISDLTKTESAPPAKTEGTPEHDDARLVSIKVNRRGAEPLVYRVPKE